MMDIEKGAIPSSAIENGFSGSRSTSEVCADLAAAGTGLSEEKQIEEMAKILCGMKNGCDGCMWDKEHCYERNDAVEIYNADYRKQEWISVEDRLPEDVYDSLPIDCIVAAKVGNEMVVDFATRTKFWQYPGRIEKTAWEIMHDWDEGEGCEITHWMPLPEAPKGGG